MVISDAYSPFTNRRGRRFPRPENNLFCTFVQIAGIGLLLGPNAPRERPTSAVKVTQVSEAQGNLPENPSQDQWWWHFGGGQRAVHFPQRFR